MKRWQNPKLAKSLRTYRIEEVAALYGCHKNTVRNWLREGLPLLDDRRPALVHGAALNAFHASRRVKAKRPCGAGELYCLACREPKRPAGDIADFVPVTANTGMLTAICPDCDRLLHQRVNAARLAKFRSVIDVNERRHSDT